MKKNNGKIHTTPPIGILITLPARFFEENPVEAYERGMERFNTEEDHLWLRVMKNLPTQDILHVYTVYGGKVQHRLNFVQFWRNETKRFIKPDGTWRTFENCNGIITAGPLVKAPYDIPMKGFQGFRYIYQELF